MRAPCSQCGALRDQNCRTPNGEVTWNHLARIRRNEREVRKMLARLQAQRRQPASTPQEEP